jgi:peroxiredoxin
VAAAVVVAGLYLRAPRATRVHVGEIAPDLTLPSVPEGRPTRISMLHGGPAVIVFFDTTWAGGDRYFEYLERMHRRYFRRGLRMVGVSMDTDVSRVAEFVARNNLTFVVVSDPRGEKIAPGWGRPQDPEAYLLDPKGRVMAVWTERVNWGDPTSKEMIERYLEPARDGHL